MINIFVLGLLLLASLLLFGRWFSMANPKKIIKFFKILLFGLIGAAVLFFIFTGKFAWAFFALPALVPWFLRVRAVHSAYRNFFKGSNSDYTDFKGPSPESRNQMSKVQALEILGLKEDANEQQIRDAHRRLITGIHPDHGGSTYLTMQINQAKETLLGK
jgi:hypothetical protein